MPEVSEIPDSEIISMLGLDEDLNPSKPEPEPADVEHGREVKASHFTEDSSSDMDTTDYESESSEAEDVRSEDASQEEPGESEPEDHGEDEERPLSQAEVLEPALVSSLKSENEDLKRQLEKAAPLVLSPTEDNPLSDMTTEAQVLGYVKQMRAMRDWCFQNLQGGEIKTKNGETIELDAAQVGHRLSRAEAILSDYAPDRLAYIKEFNQARESARRIYPQLFDSKSEWSKIANAYVSRHPAMLQDPNYEMVIGDAIAGMQARIMKSKTQSPVARKPEAPGQRALKPNPAPSSKGSVTKAQKARNDFLETGNKRDLEAMILATL